MTTILMSVECPLDHVGLSGPIVSATWAHGYFSAFMTVYVICCSTVYNIDLNLHKTALFFILKFPPALLIYKHSGCIKIL